MKLDLKYYDGAIVTNIDDAVWSDGPGGISHFRPHAPVSRPGDGVEGDLIERLVEMHKLALAVWEADRDPGMGRTLALMKLGDKAERLSDTLARAMLYVSYTRPPPAEPVSRPAGEGETTQHTPRCWGRTSYSDEMAHCYCKPAGEGEREAVARITGDDLHEILASFDDLTDVGGLAKKINERLSLLRPAAPDAGGGS